MDRMLVGISLFLSILLCSAPAYPETGAAEPVSVGVGEIIVRFLGLFLLVMAILYVLLISTKKIAGWIDSHKK